MKKSILTVKEILDYVDPDEGKIVINTAKQTCTLNFAYPYEIDLDRIRNERDLLAWTLHLSEKNWMNASRINSFIRLVAKEKKLSVFGL